MPLTIECESRVTAAEGAVSCDLAGEVVVLHIPSGVYFGLDSIGADVWNYIQQPRTFSDVRDYLMENYDVDQSRCDAGLRELLDSMAHQSLIKIDGHAASQ